MSSCLCICPNVLQSPHIEFHCSLIPKRVHHFSSPSLLNMLTCYFLRQKPWHPLHRKVTTRVSEALPWKQHHSSHFSSCQGRAEGVTRAQESLAIVPTLTQTHTLSWSPAGPTVQPPFCICPFAAAICGCFLPMQSLCQRSQAERRGYL